MYGIIRGNILKDLDKPVVHYQLALSITSLEPLEIIKKVSQGGRAVVGGTAVPGHNSTLLFNGLN